MSKPLHPHGVLKLNFDVVVNTTKWIRQSGTCIAHILVLHSYLYCTHMPPI